MDNLFHVLINVPILHKTNLLHLNKRKFICIDYYHVLWKITCRTSSFSKFIEYQQRSWRRVTKRYWYLLQVYHKRTLYLWSILYKYGVVSLVKKYLWLIIYTLDTVSLVCTRVKILSVKPIVAESAGTKLSNKNVHICKSFFPYQLYLVHYLPMCAI